MMDLCCPLCFQVMGAPQTRAKSTASNLAIHERLAFSSSRYRTKANRLKAMEEAFTRNSNGGNWHAHQEEKQTVPCRLSSFEES